MIEIIGMWEPSDAAGATDADWADRVHTVLGSEALSGGYVNLLAPDDTEQIQHAYGASTALLLEIKSRVDPEAVFTATPLPQV